MAEHNSALATSRQRAIAAILDKLSDDDRRTLVALMFEEFDSRWGEQIVRGAVPEPVDRRDPEHQAWLDSMP